MDDMDQRLELQHFGEGGPIDEVEEFLQDYRLTTAEIQYHMPDYPDLLQSYLWQSLDRIPDFPKLNDFLSYWEMELDGKLHSVRVARRDLAGAADLRHATGEFRLH